MKSAFFATILALAPVAGMCQATAGAPAAAPASASSVFTGELGYSFAYPGDWEFVDTKPMMPAAHQQAAENATTDPEKKGAECAQIGFLVRNGNPPSVIMSLTLPFDCFGSKFSQDDLPSLGEGIAGGMKKNFDTADPMYDAYKIGSHRIWIERAKGSVKGHSEVTYTLETACTILDKGMVCLFTMAKDDAALALFEKSAVTLEGEKADALVPATVFAGDKKK